jgi:hypothetical protein
VNRSILYNYRNPFLKILGSSYSKFTLLKEKIKTGMSSSNSILE